MFTKDLQENAKNMKYVTALFVINFFRTSIVNCMGEGFFIFNNYFYFLLL